MRWLLSALLAAQPWLQLTVATKATLTEMRCQTHYAFESPASIERHTETVRAFAGDVTVAFTTRETSTLSSEWRQTHTQTQTSISFATQTVTQHVTGDTLSITSTVFALKKSYQNVTETFTTKTISVSPSTNWWWRQTPDFFHPVSPTPTKQPAQPTPPSPAIPAHDKVAEESSPEQIVYVYVSGKLLPTPLVSILPLLADPPKASGVAGFPEPVDGDQFEATRPDQQPPPTLPENNVQPDKVPQWEQDPRILNLDKEAKDKEELNAAPKVAPRPIDANINRHERRDSNPSSSTSTASEPREFWGIRGALRANRAHSSFAYPTMITCTKSFIIQSTIWRPMTENATSVTQPPTTTTITSISVVTVTSTVPDQAVRTTKSFSTTSTIKSAYTRAVTRTELDRIVYSVTSTRTAFQACETANIYGPKAQDDAHIINVYSRGAANYTLFDQGYSRDPEACCIECHTMSKSCLGSVFTDGKCLLITSDHYSCSTPVAAGVFVTRPRGEELPKKGRRWPEYVISNGPCGAFVDAGTGW